VIKLRRLLKEGILDGITASFIIDSGITESVVKHGKKSLALPRYSVWGYRIEGVGSPKLMENGNDLPMLLSKNNISEDDVYPIEKNNVKETIKKICNERFGIQPEKVGKKTVKKSISG